MQGFAWKNKAEGSQLQNNFLQKKWKEGEKSAP